MRRREPGPAALEALDPLTGETLAVTTRTSEAATARSARARSEAKAQRLHRVARLLALLALVFLAAAGYFGASIAQLRGVERTWRSAMALDGARADADREVRVLLGAAAPDARDDSTHEPLGVIGTEAGAGLRRHERSLADRRIFDSKVSDLRDSMVAALEFRRFQLTPTRNRMGDTPLQKVELAVANQLDRWGMSPSVVPRPELQSRSSVMAQLRKFADVATRTTLFALAGTTLHTIDVDASTIRRRELAAPGVLVPTVDGVVVVERARIVFYPPEPGDEPRILAEGEGNVALPAGDDSGDLWITQAASGSVRRYRMAQANPGWVTEPAALPSDWTVAGATVDHLVLTSVGGSIVLWSPSSESFVGTLAPSGARFLAARGTVVLFQGPLPFNQRGGSAFLHRYHVDTDRRDLIGLPRLDAAAAELSGDDVVAVVAGPLAGRSGSMLLLGPDGTAFVGRETGPRATTEPGALAWSADGDSLYWLTPDGAIGIAHGDGPGEHKVLRTGLLGLDELAAMGR